ncbi:hypothetical protein ColKHC_09862 [Colletotrichum higginsianum]|nr:hypothetical protein ColKHC_09862 [Colletotrichum higginsianum]
MDFFIRHLTEPTAIAEEPSLGQVVLRVRETAVCLAVLGEVEYGTRLLSILHAHGAPPFDLREYGPEVYTTDYAQCKALAKGVEDHAVPVHPPRSDPFTRIVFAFAWEHVGEWPSWARPGPGPVGPEAGVGNETTLDALERYARTLVCNRFACPWREDMETFELAKGLALGQANRANPHGPIPIRMHDFWMLWERMLAPWPMNQIVKATGRVLTLDLAVRLFGSGGNANRAGNNPENRERFLAEDQTKEELIDEFIADDLVRDEPESEDGGKDEDENKSDGDFEGDEYSIEPWGRWIAKQHSAQDQMPMLGSMRALWRYGWFTDPQKNDLVKVLGIDAAKLRDAAEAGCAMLIRRLRNGPSRPYEGFTISELVRDIDANTRSNAEYAPDDAPDRESLLIERTALGPVDLDAEKIFRPATLLRHPPPSHQDISDLEKRLEVSDPLPDDYKVFLRTTDGMGPIWWNGSNLLRLLAPMSKVAVDDGDSSFSRIELELLPEWGLDGPNSISWPLLRRAIRISEGGYEGHLYLIEPRYVAEAKAAFFKVYDSATDHNRRLLLREVEEVYGSLDAFRELKWGVVLYTLWFSDMIPYKSFSAALEAFAGGSRRTPKEWNLSFDPSTRKLLGIYYRPTAEWDDSKEGRLVRMGKGNLQVSDNGTVSMGDLVYPELGFNMPMVDH